MVTGTRILYTIALINTQFLPRLHLWKKPKKEHKIEQHTEMKWRVGSMKQQQQKDQPENKEK